MSIAQRVEDAEFLWASGRFEGAFLSALIAFAATSRRLQPLPQTPDTSPQTPPDNSRRITDSKAFQDLFREQFGSGIGVSFRGRMVPLGRLFYKWLRCELVHQGGLPAGLQIDAEDTDGLFTLTLREDLPLAIPSTWYHSLIISVIGHPINADEFPQQEQMLRATLKQRQLAGQRVLGPYAGRSNYRP
jgi:hypothetical protein